MKEHFIVYIFLLFIVAIIIFSSVRVYGLARASGEILRSSDKFERVLDNPEYNILILGDSTGFGTGSRDSSNTIAGRLASDLPRATIVNNSVNGLKSDELLGIIDEHLRDHYDLVVINIGGNDIIRFSSIESTRKNIEDAALRASDSADAVAVFTTGNVGLAPFFPVVIRPVYSYRSKKLRDAVMHDLKDIENVVYVDLYKEKQDDVFSKDPQKYYAEDLLHPSDEGYGLWYDRLKEEIKNTSAGKSLFIKQ